MSERSKDWITQAEKDLKTVEEVMKGESFEWSCFVAQQAVEKAVKAVFRKINFPRVPLTSNKDLFEILCKLGSERVSLHLMKSPELDNLITEFKGEGDNIVAAIGKNSYKNGKLSINKTQYLEGIPEEVYNFHIGGYQVCRKWLKDRKGRTLTEEA